MLELCAIASGSNGNCYYIGNSKTAILIDAGISLRQIVKRMAEKNLDINKVKAVLLTHEHTDHSRGLYGIQKKLNLPVFTNKKTFNGLVKRNVNIMPEYFENDNPFIIDEFKIFPISKSHDAFDPCSFVVQYNNKSVGVFTDIGYACENVKSGVSLCDFLFLESNYDEQMLEKGKYPYFLKKRVKSDFGHLSNEQALELVLANSSEKLKTIVLSHISADNNDPFIAESAFSELRLKGVSVELSYRHTSTDVFTV